MPGLIPSMTHHRGGELPQKFSALICVICGEQYNDADAETVGRVWAGELVRREET